MLDTHPVTRITTSTQLPYADAVRAFEALLGEWDTQVEMKLIADHAPWDDVVGYVRKVAGDIGLMRFHKVDQGAITTLSGHAKECALYLVGNPETANGILDIDVRAALYVPFRVAILTPAGGGDAVLVYDQPSSFLATLANPALAATGEGLDRRMLSLIEAIRGFGKR